MSVIEQAARRLEQLQRAGVKTPEPTPLVTPASPALGEIQPVTPAPATAVPPSDAKQLEPIARPVGEGVMPNVTHGIVAAGATSRMVELDLAGLAERGIVTPDSARSLIADEFRVIKRPLLLHAALKGDEAIPHGNLVFITSALPGEGKSFTSVNLAMSIAMELDRTVLLVDADVARPSLPGMLGLPETRGLLDLLIDDSIQVADVLLRTNVENLTVLPSGSKHSRATELLASAAMARLLEEMAQRYADRIIIFDSPPLLVTTEARVLATHMGQVVLVVQADGTPQSVVKHALSTIESCPVKMILLNKARGSSHGGYGYGYGYGYGS
jgi:protein-tyrosine kinase